MKTIKLATIATAMLLSESAFAGTGGSEFSTFTTTVISYATGYPAMAVLAIGLVFGIVKLMKGEPMTFVWTMVAGMIVASFNGILTALVTGLV